MQISRVILCLMAHYTTTRPILPLSPVIYSTDPRKIVERALIDFLELQLKKLKIIWNPEAFAGGLRNPELPKDLLEKLDELLLKGERLNWKLPKPLVRELDTVIEGIETFNSRFRARLLRESEAAKKDLAAGRVYTLEELSKKVWKKRGVKKV